MSKNIKCIVELNTDGDFRLLSEEYEISVFKNGKFLDTVCPKVAYDGGDRYLVSLVLPIECFFEDYDSIGHFLEKVLCDIKVSSTHSYLIKDLYEMFENAKKELYTLEKELRLHQEFLESDEDISVSLGKMGGNYEFTEISLQTINEKNQNKWLVEAFDAACTGETTRLQTLFEEGNVNVNDRISRFGIHHSLIMGAYRNAQYETVEYLISIRGTVTEAERREIREYIMQKLVQVMSQAMLDIISKETCKERINMYLAVGHYDLHQFAI